MVSVLKKNGTYSLLDLTHEELKILRSALLKWNGDLSTRDKDLLLLDEEVLNERYRKLLNKLHAELKAIT